MWQFLIGNCIFVGKMFLSGMNTRVSIAAGNFPHMGPDIWENIVTCCKECNQFKADKTPKEAGMKLLRRPFRPKEYFVYEMKKYSAKEQMYWRRWCYKTA